MASPFERELLAEDAEETLPVMCAWCRALVRFGDTWMPLPAGLEGDMLSHGICPECLAAAQLAVERWQNEERGAAR
jgi:hypothetical protein